MKKMILIFSLLGTFGTLGLMAAPSGSPAEGETVEKTITLCGGCGQVKGGETCCKADAEACGHCKLQKGSPGCCAMEKGKDATLCNGCGEVKGGEKCCKMEGREKCGGCNMFKGSPGCKAKCGTKKKM